MSSIEEQGGEPLEGMRESIVKEFAEHLFRLKRENMNLRHRLGRWATEVNRLSPEGVEFFGHYHPSQGPLGVEGQSDFPEKPRKRGSFDILANRARRVGDEMPMGADWSTPTVESEWRMDGKGGVIWEEIEHFPGVFSDDLSGRDVYVGEKHVGVVVGERFHPRDEFVRSLRIKVEDEVASEFMRKPAELAPLAKELVDSISPDGVITLSTSMKELQRKWRNTVRIQEDLYAPDELLDRAVLDSDGMDIGNVVELIKIKRTYKGLLVKPHFMVRARHSLPEAIAVPCGQVGKAAGRLDELILKCNFSRLVTLPSFLKLNYPDDYSQRKKPKLKTEEAIEKTLLAVRELGLQSAKDVDVRWTRRVEVFEKVKDLGLDCSSSRFSQVLTEMENRGLMKRRRKKFGIVELMFPVVEVGH